MSALCATPTDFAAFEAAEAGQPHLERALRSLAHDMRQPLSTMESIVYFLQLTLPDVAPQAIDHLRRLEKLIAETDTLLTEAVCEAIREHQAAQA